MTCFDDEVGQDLVEDAHGLGEWLVERFGVGVGVGVCIVRGGGVVAPVVVEVAL